MYGAGKKMVSCYNTGKISISNNSNDVGTVAAGIVGKAAVYDKYYKSGKAYGEAGISWKPYLAKAVKVSSIKTKSCPKLSSKYWVYSSKHKRLVLKNNKEK